MLITALALSWWSRLVALIKLIKIAVSRKNRLRARFLNSARAGGIIINGRRQQLADSFVLILTVLHHIIINYNLL